MAVKKLNLRYIHRIPHALQQNELAFDAQQLDRAPERFGALGSRQHSFFTRPTVRGSGSSRKSLRQSGRRLVPPPGLPQALKHVSMVSGPYPWHTLADIQIERGRRNREGLLQRLPCFLDPTGLA